AGGLAWIMLAKVLPSRRVRCSGIRACGGDAGTMAEQAEVLAAARESGPRVWNIPARNPGFTGRDDLLAEVRERLLAGGRAGGQGGGAGAAGDGRGGQVPAGGRVRAPVRRSL